MSAEFKFNAIKISEVEFVLIFDMDQVVMYNVNSKCWTHIGYLRNPRAFSAAAFFNGKVLVTGGDIFGSSGYEQRQRSRNTEIIDIDKREIRPGGDLNHGRNMHGMATVTINDEKRLIAFGFTDGLVKNQRFDDRYIEIWNDEKEIWELNENEANRAISYKISFTTLTIPSYNNLI